VVPFQVRVVSGVYVDTLDFSLVVGKKHYYLWNPDPTPTQGQYVNTALQALGYTGDYGTALAADLSMYQALLVTSGIYPNYYNITAGSGAATQIEDYLQNDGGRVYMEGNPWYINPVYFGGHDFGPLFGIDGTGYYYNQMGPVAGHSGTFTVGMSFSYTQEGTEYNDYGSATGSGYVIFNDGTYNVAFANDAGTYRTVGSCFQLANLVDATPPSTRSALIDSIMKFFGCIPPVAIEENEGLTALRTEFGLKVYPAIAQGEIRIDYSIGHSAKSGALKIYDASGRVVKSFARLTPDAVRITQIVWDGSDDLGRLVPAGVYFVKLEAGDKAAVQKAVLLR
jgi:hypothetical protein